MVSTVEISEQLTQAWLVLEKRGRVRLQTIVSESHLRGRIAFMNKLVNEIGEQKTHPLMGLLDIVTFFVRDYEERHIEMPDAAPSAVLRLLMEQTGLRQADLADLFGTQSNVSEILSGKRQINARQARVLAERFGVSVASFV